MALRPLLLCAVACAAGASVAAQPALGTRIDSVFADRASVEGPGCVVGVRRADSTLYAHAYGMASLEHGVPLTPASVLEVGSVAKQVTAAAVVLLAQQGRLSLDDDVRRYVPELGDVGAVVTIRQMLQHTSGLRDDESLLILRDRFPGAVVYTRAEFLRVTFRQRALNFAPGAEWLYSNTGYRLAALVVERVSGSSLAAFTEAAFFGPLGMTHTRWREDAFAVVPGLATGYGEGAGGYVQEPPLSEGYGPGGLLTTVGDLLRWNDALTDGRIAGGRALVDALETPGALASGAATGYGLGLILGAYRGTREVHHDGGTGGYAAFLARYPDASLSLAVLCNTSAADPTGYGRHVADLLLPPGPAPPPRATPARMAVAPGALARLAGVYVDTLRSRTLTITASDTTLAIRGNPFIPISSTSFRNAGIGQLDFALDGALVRGVTTTNLAGVRTTYVPTPPPDTAAAALRTYEGTYRSEELGVDYVVRLNDGRLELGFDPARARLVFAFVFGEPAALTPTYRNGFEAGGIKVRFTRGASGAVDGLAVFLERARNVRFTRVSAEAHP